ncbi:metallophosphoesterase [Oscillibacter ruminantium]|uniref:metallophosphoesterase n=1 Tax=Oscillibacter ruminantium TaxID=1263547 RepID=UPI003318D6C9
MKLAFLHLSDLHLQDNRGMHPAKIQSVVESLAIYMPFEGIVIIFSGDIAAAGNTNQYKIAADFVGRLVSEIRLKYLISTKNVKILIVPGNHDVDWGRYDRLESAKIRALNVSEKEKYLFRELQSMNSYFSFSDKNGCFFTNEKNIRYGELITRKILHFDNGYRIEANLLNTAPFSCSSDDDGLHYLPEEAIQLLAKASEAEFSIVVMHHAPDWFGFSQKKELERIIAQRCSLAFYGHEHLPGTQSVCYDNGTRVVKQAGGAWWQSSTPQLSEYYVAIFDSDTRKYNLSKFSWDVEQSTFIGAMSQESTLMVKSLGGTNLIYKEAYIGALLEDTKNTIAQYISDYFIFQTLRIDASKEYSRGNTINSMKEFISFIKAKRYVAIVGGSNSGKTTLVKMLFRELQTQYIALFCGTDDITGRSQENIIKELVQNTYGENAYSSFQRIGVDKKVIVIDDLHRIAPKHLDKFLRGIEDIFGTIVVTTEEKTQFDVIQLVKDSIKSKSEFKKVSISRLYAEKRLALIKKIVMIKMGDDGLKAAGIARTLEQCLNSYKLAYRTEIDFVVNFVDYYCSHIGELDKSDATVFTKVFEASIERAIVPQLHGRRESPNDIIVALSEVAYYIHFNKEYPICAENISAVMAEYCDYYDNQYLTGERFIEIIVASGLVVRVPSGYEYRFASKNHLAYFVAKALNRKFHDTGDTVDLEKIVEQSCFGINGDILLFMTYISDNVNIPRLLLEQSVSYVSEWTEFDVSNIQAKYLESMPAKKIEAPQDSEKDQEMHDQAIEEEKNDMPIETLDIYDYDETKIDELNNQLNRAQLQLKIIARNFSAFISILPAKVKKKYALAMYQLPNKIFNKWSTSIDNSLEHLVEDIITWQKSSDFEGKKLSREDILHFFQDISLDLLLNLYFTVSTYGVNNNTVDYLAQQDYIDLTLNYKIERLMFFEKVDDYQALLKGAEAIYDKGGAGMANNMILSVLRHMLVHSDKLLDRERRRISSTYFGPKAQTKILIDRQKAQKEKGI